MSYALDTSSKVHGFPDSQLWQVQVRLLDVGGCPLGHKLVKGGAIVGDVASDLHEEHGAWQERC